VFEISDNAARSIATQRKLKERFDGTIVSDKPTVDRLANESDINDVVTVQETTETAYDFIAKKYIRESCCHLVVLIAASPAQG
jgi:hypothetical protein